MKRQHTNSETRISSWENGVLMVWWYANLFLLPALYMAKYMQGRIARDSGVIVGRHAIR